MNRKQFLLTAAALPIAIKTIALNCEEECSTELDYRNFTCTVTNSSDVPTTDAIIL